MTGLSICFCLGDFLHGYGLYDRVSINAIKESYRESTLGFIIWCLCHTKKKPRLWTYAIKKWRETWKIRRERRNKKLWFQTTKPKLNHAKYISINVISCERKTSGKSNSNWVASKRFHPWKICNLHQHIPKVQSTAIPYERGWKIIALIHVVHV